MHSRIQTRQGVDLQRLAADLGIKDSVIFADQFAVASGMMGAPDMAKWYGVLDVLSNASYGEGFGLPVIEAQACGTPVVTTAFSAMIELTGAGWCVAGDPYFNRGHNGWWMRPSAAAIASAYEDAFEQAATMRDDARKFALQYDADRVLKEHWVPVLKELLDEDDCRPSVSRGQRWCLSSIPVRFCRIHWNACLKTECADGPGCTGTALDAACWRGDHHG